MRRALAILKYVPAVLCGLLVAAWVVSLFFAFGVIYRWHTDLRVNPFLQGSRAIVCSFGSVLLTPNETGLKQEQEQPLIAFGGNGSNVSAFRLFSGRHQPTSTLIMVPMLPLLTLLLPLAIGPFNRFPLWSWFAFTAVVAGELAFYLR